MPSSAHHPASAPPASKVSDLHASAPPIDARQKELADRVMRLAPLEGMNDTSLEGLSIARASEATAMQRPVVYEPALCIVVQGGKRTVLGDEIYQYDPLHYLVVSVPLPVCAHVLVAAPEQPYLCLKLTLDPDIIARMLLDMGDEALAARDRGVARTRDRGLFVARMHDSMLDAVLRLVRMLDEPRDLPMLGPGAIREIYYRVLGGELGHRLRELVEVGSQTQRVARAIDWLNRHFAQPLRIEDLAAEVHMSASALHHRFKAVTAMSPLQYQKQLRLHEARRLMFAEGLDCAAAGHRVGYESPSQFSREYRRLFGAPPRQEITRLRQSGEAA